MYLPRLALTATAAFLALGLGGCASIVSGQNQSVSVTSRQDSGEVSGAQCSLTNDKGSWYVTTPGSVTVRRSFNDLAVNCKKDGLEPGLLTVKSSTKGMAFGNILFGGFIGAGVDMSTGAAYDYPDLITVFMGKSGTQAPVAPQPANAANDPNSVAARQNPFAQPAAGTAPQPAK